MIKLWEDLETRCLVDIDHPRYKELAEITLYLWAVNDEPVNVWQPLSEPCPPRLKHLLDARTEGVHHYWMNGRAFDTEILEHRGIASISPFIQTDVGEVAQGYGYPAGLAKLCAALGLPEDEAKDKAGKALIDIFAKPIAWMTKKGIKADAPYTWEEVQEWQQWALDEGVTYLSPERAPKYWKMFVAYGIRDVESMRTAESLLPTFNQTDKERLLCGLNHVMNKAGIRVDTALAQRMSVLVPALKESTHEQVKALTGGIKATQFKDFRAWLMAKLPGRDIPGVGKDVLERLVKEGDLPDDVAQVLKICNATKSTSVAKFGVMNTQAHPETHRVYWYIGMRKANTTGRYGAIGGLQVHNFPRPKIPGWLIETNINAVLQDTPLPRLLYNAPSLLRGALLPDEGHIFVNADLSSIEGCTLCWLSDFQEQIDDYNNGVNAYFANAPLFGFTYDDGKRLKESPDPDEYNIYMLMKVTELTMLYMGGVSALVGMGRNYGMDMAAIANILLEKNIMPDNLLMEGVRCYNFIGLTARGRRTIAGTRLSADQWIVLDAVKRAWRLRHHGITNFWAEIQRGLLMAWNNPGEQFGIGRNGSVGMMFDNNMFGIQLPSGRVLTYLDGRIGGMSEARKKSDSEIEKMTAAELIEFDEDSADDRPVLLSTGFDRNGNPLERPLVAHAGVVCNNINQGTAASVLDECIIRAHTEGWNVRNHVHDQLLTSQPLWQAYSTHTPAALVSLMSRPIAWAPGLPLKAAGEYMTRFDK